jgi:hypothetical protein
VTPTRALISLAQEGDSRYITAPVTGAVEESRRPLEADRTAFGLEDLHDVQKTVGE